MVKRFKELSRIRNERISLESNLSLNKVYGESREEIGAVLFRAAGDFTNAVAMWDFVERLGKVKEEVLRLLYQGEDDYDIMKRMHLAEEEYYELKSAIRKDFEIWTEY